MKKPLAQRLGDFLTGRGFYIVLFLCIAAIGISGYYLIRVLSSPTGGEGVTALDPVENVVLPTLTPAPTEEVTPSPAPVETGPAETPSASPAAAPEELSAPVFTWPVKGQVLAGYSLQALCYDETMGDWRTHSGTDIAAAEGARVLAMAAGTVEDVYEDGWMGVTVVVSHLGGLQSVYCNLAAQPPVSVGDTVACGQVIGSVGSSALAEAGMSSHLHLEVLSDGESVDPVNYLPQQ